MPTPSRAFKAPAARVYPKGKSGAVSGRVKKAVRRTPDTTARTTKNSTPQKPVKTPMKKADRTARANSAKAMSRAGSKGPVRYKSGGGNTKKR